MRESILACEQCYEYICTDNCCYTAPECPDEGKNNSCSYHRFFCSQECHDKWHEQENAEEA